MTLDLIVIAIYLLAINVVGIFSARAKTVNEYFLGSRSIPWIVACFSIVATETSTLTFISVPGLAYVKGVGFLQVAMGYLIGRIVVAFIFIPEYYAGNLSTVYEYLHNKFGVNARRIIAILFHITRILADGIRLFATAIPLAILMGWQDYRAAVIVIGVATFFYTYYGGIRSVVIVDAIQMVLYLFCALMGIYMITRLTGHGLEEIFTMIPGERLAVFSSGLSEGWKSLFGSYNIFSGLIGGAILSIGSHGTDHIIVQRVLACKNKKEAQKAMIWSGVIVFFQFSLFLVLGLFIMVLLDKRTFTRPDEIMPYFIINHMPNGLRGLMLAGIFAAAMSSLSSSINSLSASTVLDILRLQDRDMPENRRMNISRVVTVIWSAALILVATLIQDSTSPLIELGLGITSLLYGGILGIFIQGRFIKNFSDKAALTGVFVSIAGVIAISKYLAVFWPWYVPIGLLISLTVGFSVNYFIKGRSLQQ